MRGEYKSAYPKVRAEFGKSKIPKREKEQRKVTESKVKMPKKNHRKGKVQKVETVANQFKPLVAMLEMVAWKRGIVGLEGMLWVEDMVGKLADAGVYTLRDCVESVVVVNKRMRENGHEEIGQMTLSMMMAEVGEMMVWPGEWYTPCDV